MLIRREQILIAFVVAAFFTGLAVKQARAAFALGSLSSAASTPR